MTTLKTKTIFLGCFNGKARLEQELARVKTAAHAEEMHEIVKDTNLCQFVNSKKDH